jgi:tetratricopeptide (TPR) repeat protein
MIEILLQAERALSAGLVDQAERLYRQAAEADPRNSIAVVGLARVALERGDEPEAWRQAARALAIDPENVAAQRLAGRLEEVFAERGEPLPGVPEAGAAPARPPETPAAVPEPAPRPEPAGGPVPAPSARAASPAPAVPAASSAPVPSATEAPPTAPAAASPAPAASATLVPPTLVPPTLVPPTADAPPDAGAAPGPPRARSALDRLLRRNRP